MAFPPPNLSHRRSITDLSAGATWKLGFYEQETARVLVETVNLEGR